MAILVNSSPKHCDSYLALQKGRELIVVTLILDVKTHWNSTLATLERAYWLRPYMCQRLLNDEFLGFWPLYTTEDEWQAVEYVLEVLTPFRYWTLWMSKRHTITLHRVISIYNEMFDHLEGAMRSFKGKCTAWKVDVRRTVRASHKKLQCYYSEVTPESGLLLILAALLDPFRKTKTFRTWDAGMNIDPKDSESYTAQYTEAFIDYWEEMYVVPQCAPKSRKEDLDSHETKSDMDSAMFDSSTSRSASPDVAYFRERSDDFADSSGTPACPPITPARVLPQDRLMEVARKYIKSVNADPAALGQHPPKTDNLKSENPQELTAAFWKPDVAAYWQEHEDSCTEYAPLARMARDVFSVIPHGIGVEASFSLGCDVLGWRQCRTSGDMLQKKVIVRQFSRSNPGILAGADIGLPNNATAAQNEQKEEDKKLLKLAGISDHIHFRRGRKERK